MSNVPVCKNCGKCFKSFNMVFDVIISCKIMKVSEFGESHSFDFICFFVNSGCSHLLNKSPVIRLFYFEYETKRWPIFLAKVAHCIHLSHMPTKSG